VIFKIAEISLGLLIVVGILAYFFYYKTDKFKNWCRKELEKRQEQNKSKSGFIDNNVYSEDIESYMARAKGTLLIGLVIASAFFMVILLFNLFDIW